MQWIGIVLPFIGLWLYNDFRQRPVGKENAPEILSGDGQEFLAGREDEAVNIFGMDKFSRRRLGLLPTSGSFGSWASGGVVSGEGLVVGGPVWKWTSSTLYGQGGPATAHANQHEYGVNGGRGGLGSPNRD